MARRILNRKDLRADYEAAERRKADDEEEGDEEEGDEEDEAEAEADEAEEEEGDEDDEEAPVKKKKAKPPPKEPKARKSRAAKQVRMKVVWCVFNNSNQKVATFEYKKKDEAYEHAAKLAAAKNPPQPFFVQPVKEPMDEK
jgi:hypothetical protein